MCNIINFILLLEIGILGLHPTQANLGYFLAYFQSLQLPSTQSESIFSLLLGFSAMNWYVLREYCLCS
jgi:hypothetical protein